MRPPKRHLTPASSLILRSTMVPDRSTVGLNKNLMAAFLSGNDGLLSVDDVNQESSIILTMSRYEKGMKCIQLCVGDIFVYYP